MYVSIFYYRRKGVVNLFIFNTIEAVNKLKYGAVKNLNPEIYIMCFCCNFVNFKGKKVDTVGWGINKVC